jgi:DNA-binding winged helix-turn-helix (wHTH) protein
MIDAGRGLTMIENPFFHRGPIRDLAYFYNRRKEVKWALEMLGRGQSVSVTGPRKIGKTSLLFHISQPEVMRRHGLDPARYLFVYFNCEGLSNLDREDLYVLILKEIVAKAARQGLDFEVPEHPNSYISFERALRDALSRKLRLVLLFDEFESLSSNRNLGSEFLSGLRALTARFDIAYVTVSQRPLSALAHTQEYTYTPFFNIFVPLKLGLFDEAGSRELIEDSIRKTEAVLPQEVISMVLDLGGEHPFLLQVAGYWALELQATKGAPLGSKDFRILAQTVRGQVESHFEYYWSHLSPEEQYVLAALPFTQSAETYREELEALACLCLIVKEDGGYKYFSPLFPDFVRHQEVKGLLQAGPFVLSMSHQCALLREEPLPLSARQFALLRYFMERQGQVVSNEELEREVMATSPEEQQEYDYLGDERLKSAIRGLRKALGDEAGCIVNKRGVGYMFQLRVEE